MKYLTILMMFMSVCVFAQGVDLSGLTDAEKEDLKAQAAQLRADKAAKEEAPMTTERVTEYALMGKAVAEAFGAAAKEMNVAVNDFATSPVGKVTMVLIIWKVAGKDMARIILPMVIFILFFPCWIYAYRRMCIIKSVKRVSVPLEERKWYSRNSHKDIQYYEPGDCDGTRGMMGIVLLVAVGVTMLGMFAG